ncbi:cupin domain-containing protein [Hoyosella altamirensis]|uniref:Mannose-6-phosphate isomerase-like protein (Cupin superfamily) n=1 Tax=Hoyosella altamirensis TaxID=616997 RepID=A0A839RQD6_9ACTN|nr:cupin domain-containing protein [Hoyosella altamirensis]MBB3038173.1 mannose-6-phosphate isomerase-like protein (cupin superfamily) [Hoyosella altamirensis]
MEQRPELVFRSGHRIRLLAEGSDGEGDYLRLEHQLPKCGRQAGPHWHPVLGERWTVREGKLRFRIDGTETVATPGTTVNAPARAVHEFWNESADTVIEHEIRPPLRHWEMFTLWRNLDVTGKTTRSGVPRGPLALALLWDYQDGYIAGIPVWIQRVALGTLARVARLADYERRWATLDAT